MSKKKIRQGQSVWIAWVYDDVKRDVAGRIVTEAKQPDFSSYSLERVEVVTARQGKVVVKIGNTGTSTFTEAEFRALYSSRNRALRKISESQLVRGWKGW